MRASLAVLTALTLCVRARADIGPAKPLWKTGVRGTVGSSHYVGRGAYLQYGDDWRVKGSYSDYRQDGSTGTVRTASVRGGYQGENLSAGASFSVSPRNANYANRSFGLDGSWTFFLADGKDDAAPSGLEEVELGGWWTQTRHSQIIPATIFAVRERNVVINQHDLGVSAALTGWDFTLSLDASRTFYDQDFSALPSAALQIQRLGQTAALVNGFPDRSGSVRLEYERWKRAVPYVSFSATRYKIQPQPASATSGVGVAFKQGAFGLDLGLERTRQKGSPDTKYFNFGGSFRF